MSATAVLRDETVRTGVDSATRLVMADNTNLSLGPSATITLDRTVFNDEHSYRDIAIKLSSGAFRFVTGQFGKSRLQDHDVGCDDRRARHHSRYSDQRNKTTVVLQEGASQVCAFGGSACS